MDVHGRILEKRLEGGRLSLEEGILLYSCDLLRLGDAANRLADRFRPDGRVTFIVDRNVSYTNACVLDCDFCAFYRSPGHAEAYVLSDEEIFKKIQELVDLGGTQVLIQGGVKSRARTGSRSRACSSFSRRRA
jgi:cyclic dehypoxanthinyl futalosine synthase